MTHDHHEHLNLGLQRVDESVVWCVCVCVVCLLTLAACLVVQPCKEKGGCHWMGPACLLPGYFRRAVACTLELQTRQCSQPLCWPTSQSLRKADSSHGATPT